MLRTSEQLKGGMVFFFTYHANKEIPRRHGLYIGDLLHL